VSPVSGKLQSVGWYVGTDILEDIAASGCSITLKTEATIFKMLLGLPIAYI